MGLSFEMILAAKNHDPKALDDILAHFDRYITTLSMESYTDKYGVTRSKLNPEIKHEIQVAVMLAIHKFDIERNLKKNDANHTD